MNQPNWPKRTLARFSPPHRKVLRLINWENTVYAGPAEETARQADRRFSEILG